MTDEHGHDLSREEEEQAIKTITERFFPGTDHDPLGTRPEAVELLGDVPPRDVFAHLEQFADLEQG